MIEEEYTPHCPVISVIIPAFNDWERLGLCLQALSNQTLEKSKYEIIIVNNEDVHVVPSNFKDLKEDNITILHEPMPGSYAARNTGLKVAKGHIIGFTDSDCIPASDWLENSLNHFSDQSVDRIAGKVELFCEHRNRKSVAELYESAFSFDQERNVRTFKASITANFFTRKTYFDKVGLFNPIKKSGEDFGWNRRANKYNLALKYADDVVVRHPARSSLNEIARKKRRVFGGKKVFDFRSIKGISKELLYCPFLFANIFLRPVHRLFFHKKGFSFFEKLKISLVQFYVYLVTQIEYFRLLFGGKPLR